MKRWILLFGILCILFMSIKVEAATPRVMVSDVNVAGGGVISGEDFDLDITFKNESTSVVKNMKITISTENGELLPSKGAGTAYVKELKGETEETISFPMSAAFGLEEKSYKLNIKSEYEGGGIGYTVEDSVFIPVSLNQRLSVTDIYSPKDSYEVGETVEISGVVNNLGSGNLYNVSVKVVGDNVSIAESYVGNIEPGKSGTVDLLTKATVVTEGGHINNNLIVCYEDKSGNVFEEEIALQNISVVAVVYDEFEVVKDSKDYSGIWKSILIVIVTILIIGLVSFLWWKRRKKKLAYLDEF